LYKDDKIDDAAIERSLVSYQGHLKHGNTYGLRKKLEENREFFRKVKEEKEQK